MLYRGADASGVGIDVMAQITLRGLYRFGCGLAGLFGGSRPGRRRSGLLGVLLHQQIGLGRTMICVNGIHGFSLLS